MPAVPLQALLGEAVERSFHEITVDGDTSTNDTVLLLAGGPAGPTVEPGHPAWPALSAQASVSVWQLASGASLSVQSTAKLAAWGSQLVDHNLSAAG